MARWYQDLSWEILRYTFVKSLKNKYKVEAVHHDPEPEGPFILLANHAHAHDPYMIGGFMGDTVNYMSNLEGVSPLKRRIAHLVGAFNKKKGSRDLKSLRQTIELIKAKSVVGIFPEGDRSWDGRTAPMIPGTASLAKKLQIPIRIARLTGNYLSWPRWADEQRYGRILIEFYTITAEEIASSKPDAIEEKISALISQNDIRNPANSEIDFKCSNPAAGIQRLLWKCPACKAEDSIEGSGNEIRCRKCGESWEIDCAQRLNGGKGGYKDLLDWVDFQQKCIKEAAAGEDGKLLTETTGIDLGIMVNRKMTEASNGTLKLFKDRTEFCKADGETILFENSKIMHVIDNFNKAFEFDYDGKRYRALFHDQNALKWIEWLLLLKQ